MTESNSKRWYRPRNVILAVAVVLLGFLLWAGYWIRWAYTAQPTISVDYAQKLIELSESHQPEGENAWPLLMQAAAHLEKVEREVEAMGFEPRVDAFDSESSFNFGFVQFDEFYPERIKREREALRLLEQRGTFAMLSQALRKPRAVARSYESKRVFMQSAAYGDAAFSIELGRLQQLTQMETARMRIAADAGEFATVIEAFNHIMFIAEAAALQPPIKARDVSIALEAAALHHLQLVLIEHEVPMEVAVEARSVLSQYDKEIPLSLTVDCIRYRVLDTIQRTYTDDGEGDGRFLPVAREHLHNTHVDTVDRVFSDGDFELQGFPEKRKPSNATRNLATFLYAGRADTEAELERVTKAMKTLLNDDELELDEKLSRLDAISESLSDEHPPLVGQFDSLASTLTSMLYNDVEIEATRIMLAIKQFEAQHGRLPESLDELTPEIVVELPIVPVTGNAFGYRVLDEPDEHGRRYLLYVLGAGGVDNGGTHLSVDIATLPDLLMVESLGEQYDWVVNQPRQH